MVRRLSAARMLAACDRVALPILAALLVSSCAASGIASPSRSEAQSYVTGMATPSNAASPTAAPYSPVSIANCGTPIQFARPPQRVVSADPRFTELLLALGLGDRVVGTLPSYPSELEPSLSAAYERIPLVGQDSPTLENVVAASPDLVWASPFFFTDQTLGTRDSWSTKGVATYVPAGSCSSSGASVSDTYSDILAMGSIFGVTQVANALVDNLKTSIAATHKVVEASPAVSVFVFALLDPGNPPFTRGNLGIANDLVEQAGGKNVFANLTGFTKQVDWETVVKADPDFIVVLDADDAAAKLSELSTNPVAATLRAVKQHRIVAVPIHSVSTPDLHNAEVVSLLARSFHPEDY